MATTPSRTIDPIEDVDIVMIGGGPAGASTALHLHAINPALLRRTLLLQRNPHARELGRSGALTQKAEAILHELGVSIDAGSEMHRVRLVYGGVSIEPPKDVGAQRIIRHRDFDHVLLRSARECGLRAMEDVRVLRVVRHPNHLQVVTQRGDYRAQVVVGCDGVGGAVRSAPWFSTGRMARCYSIETPPSPAGEPGLSDPTLLIDLSYIREGLAGYYWELTHGVDGRRHVSRGIVTASRRGSQAYLEEVLQRRGVSTGGAIRTAWPIRHFDPSERQSCPRMLLAGEAMGSAPLFSDALSQGLAGGQIAAEALDDAFRRNDLSFSSYTRRVRRSPLGRELKACARAARWLYGRHSESVLSLLHHRPELTQMICDGFAGRSSLADVLSRIGRLVTGPLRRYGRDVQRFRGEAAIDRALAQRPVGDRSLEVGTRPEAVEI